MVLVLAVAPIVATAAGVVVTVVAVGAFAVALHLETHLMTANKYTIMCALPFQVPKQELLYHIKPYFFGTYPLTHLMYIICEFLYHGRARGPAQLLREVLATRAQHRGHATAAAAAGCRNLVAKWII